MTATLARLFVPAHRTDAEMQTLTNKRILLGITGGIAAYKCAELTRLFVKAGAEVRVVMTEAATTFVTPLTLQALSGQRVHLDLLDAEAEAAMGHIELARWADLVLVAPASADFLARLTAGRADDLLTTLILATRAPVALAPAMNQGMWADSATQDNLARLRSRNYLILGPADGDQACGDVGPGRMLEPTELAQHCAALFPSSLLSGRHLVLTAGPTREAIDPVRFLSNHSSGRMGYALAGEAAAAGARVTLISGPVSLPTPDRVRRIDVVSADDMRQACLSEATACDVFIGVAAVADYRPATVAPQKIKKTADRLTLELIRNPDIISAVSQLRPRPFMVGFAAETDHLAEHARGKRVAKNLDLVFANPAVETFGADTVSALAVSAAGITDLGTANKSVMARAMLALIAAALPPLSP